MNGGSSLKPRYVSYARITRRIQYHGDRLRWLETMSG